ncbi:hypothetical protein P4T04_05050 [Bacillus badius]|uniref:hypothetical protein n=1 Tax=Bacillus badius TaxID=1455 RepID=UPI002E1E823B|nr:hypothetical protein [Bacillus badius]
MLTIEERRQLKNLLEVLDKEEEQTNKRDVSNRSRDKNGRFKVESEKQEEDLPSKSVREIKLVKVKGTYNSYYVRTKRLDDWEKEALLILGILSVMAIIL